MRFVTTMFALGGLFMGLYYSATSLTAQIVTGEHAAILGCACFLFVIALGVWQDTAEKQDKRRNALLEEMIRRTPKPPPPPSEDYLRPR